MRITTARVTNGRVEVDAESLPEGREIKVVLLEDDPVKLTEIEKMWLSKALTEAQAGDLTDAFDFLAELEGAN
jgi:hypothetical protein